MAACQQLEMLAALSARSPSGALREWFGDGAGHDLILMDNVRRKKQIITDKNRAATFVDARTHDLKAE